jgi:hypothetical protein
LERNEIEEGAALFSLYQGALKGAKDLSSGEGMFGKQVENA